MRDDLGRDQGAGAGTVVDNHRLPEGRREFLADHPRQYVR